MSAAPSPSKDAVSSEVVLINQESSCMWCHPSGLLVPTYTEAYCFRKSSNTAALIRQLLDPPLRKRPPLTMGRRVQLEINDFLVEISWLSRYLLSHWLAILRRSSVDILSSA